MDLGDSVLDYMSVELDDSMSDSMSVFVELGDLISYSVPVFVELGDQS